LITLKLEDRRGTVEPELFGCLIEDYGTLRDGIWVGDDPDVPNDDGLRLDTIKAFREIGMQVIRFPGGTPADCYRWRDGIGPRSERPRTWNFFFGGESINEFGTDEFLRLCATVGASASIKVNPISLPLQDTLDWMQYCLSKSPGGVGRRE
jgi:alpha-N-arabinofuranosidase